MTHAILIKIDMEVDEEKNARLLHDFETALGSHRRLELVRVEGQDDVDEVTGECHTRVYFLAPLP